MLTVQHPKYGERAWRGVAAGRGTRCGSNHTLTHRKTRPAAAGAGLFDCKPLQFLWAKFPEHYGAHNTIMMDDLRRSKAPAVLTPAARVRWMCGGAGRARGSKRCAWRHCPQLPYPPPLQTMC